MTLADRLGLELSDTDAERLDLLYFFTRLLVLATPLYVLLWIDWNPVWLRTAQAGIATQLLELLGVATTRSGTVVETARLVVDVSVDSTGWKSMLAVSALVLAVTDATRRQYGIGVVAGLLTVLAANMVRLVSMIYAVVVWGISYELIHTLLWRWGLTVVVLGYWMVWLYWVSSDSLPLIDRIRQHREGEHQQAEVPDDEVEEGPRDDQVEDDDKDAADGKH